MISLSPEAETQLNGLLAFYEERQRPQATRNLITAVQEAAGRIERTPEDGEPAPRPYPTLASLGFLWIKVRIYWFAYSAAKTGFVIGGIFHESADIPNRIL